MDRRTERFYRRSYKTRKNLFGRDELQFMPKEQGEIESYIDTMSEEIFNEVSERGHCWLLDYTLIKEELCSWDYRAFIKAYDVFFQVSLDSSVSEKPCDDKFVKVTCGLEKSILRYYKEVSEFDNGDVSICRSTTLQCSQLGEEAGEREEMCPLQENFEFHQLRNEGGHGRISQKVMEVNDKSIKIEAENEKNIFLTKNETEEVRIADTESDTTIKEEAIQATSSEQENCNLNGQRMDMLNQRDVDDRISEMRISISNAFKEHETKLIEYESLFVEHREKIERMLNCFKGSIDSKIADAYQQLYLFATSNLKQWINKLFCEIERTRLDENTTMQIRRTLPDIQGKLMSKIGELEKGMQGLGLSFIRPRPGDVYNCDDHAAVNAVDDGRMNTVINECVCPGVKYGVNTLCRAGVILKILE